MPTVYQHGRAELASGHFTAGEARFRSSFNRGLPGRGSRTRNAAVATVGCNARRSARDLALRAGLERGVTIAAFELGSLYEHGVSRAGTKDEPLLAPDEARAWSWYQKGADTREPNALARLAQRADSAAFLAQSTAKEFILAQLIQPLYRGGRTGSKRGLARRGMERVAVPSRVPCAPARARRDDAASC